ncbi:MAG TPA: SRPBCC domain-containing protein [Allosphingosinicella sp.]|nr:SRPBCC domain-containing protein [Allosphingosinicella sp.]
MKFAIGALLLLCSPVAAAAPDQVSSARVQEADGSHTLTHEVVVDAPAGEVWAAVSTPKGWTTWAVPVAWHPAGQADVLETSYTPTARPGDSTTIRQQFLARIPGRLLVFRTIKAPAGFPDFPTYAKVISFIELEPLGSARTRVRLTGTGYPDTASGRKLLGFFTNGNRFSLESLSARFRDGPVDWPSKLATMGKGPAPKAKGE